MALLTPQQLTAGACLVPLVALVWRAGGNLLYKHFTRKSTILYELEHIGEARPDNKRIKGTAVICGGSIAGLWTARVAVDHFEEVVIVEPEAWVGSELGRNNAYTVEGEPIKENATPIRTRIVQYNNSIHVFQPMAYRALKKYFPNFDDEVRGANGRIQEFEVTVYAFGRKFMNLPEKNPPICFWLSRDGYERVLRRLVLASSDRIRWVTGTAVGVKTDQKDPSKLSSVLIRSADDAEQEIQASMVIDCTGRTQAGFKWIRRIMSETENAKELQSVVPSSALPWDKLKVSYSCGTKAIVFGFFVPPEARSSLPIPGGYENNVWPYTYMPIPGVEHKFYIINRVEGHCINVGFSSWGETGLPESFDDIKPWLKKFEVDHDKVPEWVYALVDRLIEFRDQAVVQPVKYPDQTWIYFESAPYIPSNFVAIGDSVMTVNPTFGQGCSKATIGAIALDGMLREFSDATSVPAGFGRKFFKIHRDKIFGIWDGTKPTDYMFPTTTPVEGEKLSDERLKGRVASLLMELAGLDKEVDQELLGVRYFTAPPEALFKPHLLLKYAIFAMRKYLGLVPSARNPSG